MKGFSASLAIEEMKIQTKIRYHFTTVRMAIINLSTKDKSFLARLWCRLVPPLWKSVWNFLRKLKMELPFDPAIPLLVLYPTYPETPIKRTYAPQCS